tara:strand:+ start:2246 stop:2932 length:687 start_codon:yes stop_codon:yes gene_type:complete
MKKALFAFVFGCMVMSDAFSATSYSASGDLSLVSSTADVYNLHGANFSWTFVVGDRIRTAGTYSSWFDWINPTYTITNRPNGQQDIVSPATTSFFFGSRPIAIRANNGGAGLPDTVGMFELAGPAFLPQLVGGEVNLLFAPGFFEGTFPDAPIFEPSDVLNVSFPDWIGDAGATYRVSNFSISAVPIPPAFVMLLPGICSLMTLAHRKRPALTCAGRGSIRIPLPGRR